MGTARETLIDLGERESNDAMVEQTGKTIDTGDLYKEKLLATGFSELKFKELKDDAAKLSELLGLRHDTAQGSKRDTLDHVSAVGLLKDHFRRLNTLMPIVMRDHRPEGVNEDVFAPNGRLGNSAKGLITHADKTRPVLLKLNDFFVPYFEGKSPVEEHDQLRNAVYKGNSQKKTARETGPTQTAEINAIKGRLVELIDDMNRVGRVAFMHQAEIAARFNKDLLVRARRGGAKKAAGKAEAPAPAPTEPAKP